MPRTSPTPLALAICAIAIPSACTEPAVAPESTTTGTSTATTSTTTSGADSTAGSGDDCPIVPHTDPVFAQALTPNYAAVTPFDARIGSLCPGTSHYFVLDNPCPVYLALDLRGNPTAIDNNSEDFDLYLTEHYDPMQPGGSYVVHESNASPSVILGSQPPLPFEALHRYLGAADGEPHLIEVRHVAGGELDYELQATPLAAGSCLAFSWICEATHRIEAEETACTTEPTPSCTATTTAVALPTVEDGATSVDGWRVHTSPAEVKQVRNPTSTELALIEARCVQACQAEWAYDDAVSANCSVADGFETPRAAVPSEPAIDAIATSVQDGSGIFTNQRLTCNLADTCCDAFDEDVCIAIPRRVTPGPGPLGVGEEYRLGIGGSSLLTIETSAGSWTSTLSGEVGYSMCPGGNAGGPCPFYLGSGHASATQQPTITLSCSDGTQVQVEVDEALVSLDQPAMGIDAQGNSAKGFPPGALVLKAELTLGNDEHERRTTNTEPVVLLANGTSFQATAEFAFLVPCNRGVEQVTATFELASPTTNAVLEQPPSVTITTPSSVTCSTSVSLTATTSDPDGDLDSVRWYVDDELLASSVSSIPITMAHTLRAVARDERGAATTATKAITCTP